MKDKRVKVHCTSQLNSSITCCGRVYWTVLTVGGFIFNMVKPKHQCKKCAKSKNQ